MIPPILWQTYKTKKLPLQYLKLSRSWRVNAPSVKTRFMDDRECDEFIRNNFDKEFYQMYSSLPFGVMKADIWRVAVVYIHGGIYADTDVECVSPISEWFKPNDKLLVSVESEAGALCNWIFAAEPKHPAIKHALDTIVERYNAPDYLSKDSPCPIQDFGQNGFSYGVLSYYGLQSEESHKLGGNTNYYNESVAGTGTRFILAQDGIFTNGRGPKSKIVHHVASMNWRVNYDSWRDHQKEIFGI